MKKNSYFLLYPFVGLALITSCSRRLPENVVCESYVHRYGIPLSEEEWSTRGQDGRIETMTTDGVLISRSYDHGILDGETTYTFPHRDTIQKREMYRQGVLTQEIFYFSNGIPQQEIVHHAPQKRELTVWYENGAPQLQEEYHENRLTSGEYFTPAFQRESTVNDGQGIRTRYDDQGQLLSRDEIQNGQMVLRTTFHPNHTPQSITSYVNEVAEGEKFTYLPDGSPNTIEKMKNDKQEGDAVQFENGERVSVMTYVNGKRNGIEKRYRDGEVLVEEVTWVDDQKHGPAYIYLGDVKKTDWYFQGKKVNKQTFDALTHQQ